MQWPYPGRGTGGFMPTHTAMGPVELLVHDLDAILDFYHEFVGLNVLEASENRAVLGITSPIITLEQRGELPVAEPGSAGLFHSAIVYASRGDLARALMRLARLPHLYQGSADHGVSEAFYFADPEGNGLELYVTARLSSGRWVRTERSTW